MHGLPPILISASAGFVTGMLLAIPVGPVNLTILNEGARRGFRHSALIATGALFMEFTYCAAAFSSFAGRFNKGYAMVFMDVGSFLFMLGLGIWFLTAKSVNRPNKVGERLEEKLHPTSTFMTGVVRVLGNLGVPASWLFFGSYFVAHGWVEPTLTSKGACVIGVTLGTGLWFFGLAYAVSLGHKKFSDKTLLRMEKGSGIGLLILGLAHGCQIWWEVAHHKYFL